MERKLGFYIKIILCIIVMIAGCSGGGGDDSGGCCCKCCTDCETPDEEDTGDDGGGGTNDQSDDDYDYDTNDYDTSTDNEIVNHAPEVTNLEDVSMTENDGTEAVASTISLSGKCTDADVGDTLSWTMSDVDEAYIEVEFDPDAGTASVTSQPYANGETSITFTCTDSYGESDTGTVDITIAAENFAPKVISSPVTSAKVGQLYTYDINAEDPDGDTLTYRLHTGPSGMTIDASSGVISWTPTAAGTESVVYSVVDPGNAESRNTYTLTITT